MTEQQQDTKEIILITGATSGLGRLTAKKCINSGHTVIITGRSQSNLDAAKKFILEDSPQHKDHLYELIMDLGDLHSIKKAVETLESFNLPSLDVIVHNAGGALPNFEQIQGVEKTVFVNSIAPLYLNRLLLPHIEKSTNPKKRIIFVSSSLHNPKSSGAPGVKIPESVDMADLAGDKESWDSMKYYKLSKLADMWDSYALASRYPQLKVIAFCPGFVPTTELARNSPFILKLLMKYILPNFKFTVSEDDSTNDYIYYITSDDIESGKHYQKQKATESSTDSYNEEKQNVYWKFANDKIDEILSKK
jgi:NAD(P)-dependent dehydrogenase (short-subunit alcohol dehydrogenase family)